jgi:hypothetical protein
MEELEIVKRLTDDELVLRVRHCVREDRRVSAQLLAHLGEIEVRGLHRDLGYESMFDYAVRVLHMSDSEAGLRLHAARFARKFPASLEMLSRGELHLTALKLLAPVLTPENAELLNMACLKTKQEIQLLIAKHCPQPDVPEAVRRLPVARSANTNAMSLDLTLRPGVQGASASRPAPLRDNRSPVSAAAPATDATLASVPSEPSASGSQRPTIGAPTQVAQSQVDRGEGTSERPLPVAPAPHASNREPALPISEGRYKIQFTAGQRVRDLLQEAQDLFRNQLPNGDIDVLFERALVLLVSERKKQLYAQTDKPRRSLAAASASKPNSRYIPNATKRRVYVRDQGQCRFVSPSGERCCARSRLEFHHVHAFGFGGRATEQNIVLLCHAHNALLAERDYSREHIQRCIRASQADRRQPATARPSAQLKTQLPDPHPTHAKASEQAQLSTSQYKPTRSGTSRPHERHAGLNHPRAGNMTENTRWDE